MAAYLVANFTITNPTAYREYVPAVVKTLEAVGAEILVADYESEALEGQSGAATVVVRFATKEALTAGIGRRRIKTSFISGPTIQPESRSWRTSSTWSET